MEDWVWSYSRINTFDQCKYEFFMKYILSLPPVSNFYSEFGSYVHHILKMVHTGEIGKENAIKYFTDKFDENVISGISTKIRVDHILSTVEYLSSLKPVDNIILCEERLFGKISGFDFIGFADLIYQDGDSVIIRDHKSRNLKPKIPGKKRKTDDELDRYFRQLYIYANLFRQEYKRRADALEFNCYRVPVLIRENNSDTDEMNTVLSVGKKIREIMNEESFKPNLDYFYCNNLCEMRENCEYRCCAQW